MLVAHVVKELVGGSGAPGLHIVVALLDAPNGLLEILALPFQVVDQRFVEDISRSLSTTTGKFLQFGLALGS